MNILSFFFEPSVLPFTISFGLMCLIFVFEAIMMMLGGLNLSSLLPEFNTDVDLDIDPEHFFSGWADLLVSWTLIGKVPVIILIALWTGGFGISGIAIQNISHAFLGNTLPIWIAILISLPFTLIFTKISGTILAKIMPKEISFVVQRKDFLGQIATINIGTARYNLPAEAKLRDAYGNLHYVRVRPEMSEDEFGVGTEVLLLKEEDNGVYLVIKTS